LPVLWTFENQKKLKAFTEILELNEIPFVLMSKGKQVPSGDGLTVSVGEDDFKQAKKLLLSHRRRNSSQQNRKC